MDIKDLIIRIQEEVRKESEPIIEDAATETTVQDKMKSFYKDKLNGELDPTTYNDAYELGWRKFWILTDGTIVPVKFSHIKSVEMIGHDYTDLLDEGAVDGAVVETEKWLLLRLKPGVTPITSNQIRSIVKIYNKYPLDTVRTHFARVSIGNSRELSIYLRTGTAPRRKEFERKVNERFITEEELLSFATTELDSSQQTLKDYYKKEIGTPLTKSTYPGETDWKKFWLLTDGTVVPVRGSSHGTACDIAGVSWGRLIDSGALSGYIIEDKKELGLRGDKNPTNQQILAIQKLYKQYVINTIYAEMFPGQHDAYVENSSDVSNYLRTGVARKKKEWERKVKEDLSTLSDPKLKKWFIQDKLEQIDSKMEELANLAKAEKKGEVRSSIFAKIDQLEREKTELLRGMN